MTNRLSARADEFRQIALNGQAIADEIEAEAGRLAEKMERFHGSKCRVEIDHYTAFLLIRLE